MTAKTYSGKDILITYDASRCIHAAQCVRGAPLAFDPAAKPWIQPDKADAATLAEVVRRCPTGALTATRVDGSALDAPDAENRATLQPNGPIYLRGRISASVGASAAAVECTRVAICRCGASNNKPFCDGSHTRTGFTDSGACARTPISANAAPTGPVMLNPIPNGPLMVEGRVEFSAADGIVFVTEERTWLCRCGQSANKPFCDGAHKRIGFTA